MALPEGDLALLQDFRRDLAQKKSEMVRLRRISGSGRLSPFGKRVAEDRIRVVEESIRRLEGVIKNLAGGARPAGEGGGTVEAEFCGRTLVDVILRVDAFMKATGLVLVERSLLGFVESRGERQECHRAVFRK